MGKFTSTRDTFPRVTPTSTLPARPMEHLVRPFQVVESAPPELPTVRRLRPGEDTEASLCAGGPARFLRENLTEPVNFYDNTSSRTEVIWPDQPTDGNGDPVNPGDVVYQEIERVTETIRVENPDDATMWVDVKRTEKSTFQHQGTGTRLVLIFDNNLEG